MKELGVGIFGFGFMGKTHTYGYKTIPLYYEGLPFRLRLVGVCDSNRSTAEKARDTQGFEFATDDPNQIWQREDIHLVSVCTPNLYHKDLVLGSLQAGKHVYCDKPLACNTGEEKEILEALPRYPHQTTQMAMQYRFFPATLRAKELIEEGFLGRVFSFRAGYFHSSAVDPKKPLGWKQEKRFGGGGVLFDLGSHILDLMYHLLGEYQSVLARTDIVYPERPDQSGTMCQVDADDQAFLLVQMKNGSLGVIEASKIATGTNDELRFEIHGDRGALRFNLMDPNWLEIYDNTLPDCPLGGRKGYTAVDCTQRYPSPGGGFPNPRFSIGWIRSHVACLYNFVARASAAESASPSFAEGAYIQRVMERAYQSDQAEAWLPVDSNP